MDSRSRNQKIIFCLTGILGFFLIVLSFFTHTAQNNMIHQLTLFLYIGGNLMFWFSVALYP